MAELETLNHALRLDAERSAEQSRFQLDEMEHRLKNTFATVQGLAEQTARSCDTAIAFRDVFSARLLALARSHDFLGSNYPDGAPLTAVVGQCLQPYQGSAGRIRIDGPAVHLLARDVPALGLALHELTTNAAKHGSLSIPAGRVEVTWRLEVKGEDRTPLIAITWQESGGPPVKAPERRGFGSRLLARGLTHASGGSIQIDFPPYGVECRIWLPLTSGHIPDLNKP